MVFERQSVEEVARELDVDVKLGLTSEEAGKRLLEYGENAFTEKKGKTILQMFLGQLKDPMIYILMVATVVSAVLGEFIDASIIVAIILLNAVIGVVQENKAEESLEALKKMSSPTAIVRRDGQTMEIAASHLVPGDLVLLEAGRVIPADLRLIQTINLKAEESALTGESVPVEKDASFVADSDLGVGDRINMAYLSTGISFGRGEGLVTATGMDTEIGKIAKMINESVDELTPLQKRLGELGKLLGIVALVICIVLFIVAVIQGRDVMEMLLTAISLAVAAIPEGLPAVVTIVLALGVQRMVKVNTIVRKLPAVETLGSVSIVCSDKTGTLTQNMMTVTKAYMNGKLIDADDLTIEENGLLIKGMMLCTDAETDPVNNIRMGDPTELALIDIGSKLGESKDYLEHMMVRINENPFDSARKMMTTVHESNDGREEIISFTKGAMDKLILKCNSILIDGEVRPLSQVDRENIEVAGREMACLALRVLALAYKSNDSSASEEDLTFIGLLGMIDPPRPEAAGAVEVFNDASIRTIMITGDHKDTALAIAKELGIADDESQSISGDELDKLSQEELNERIESLKVFARVSPEHKVMIVNAFKSRGHIVSMTGDGVNDAPSLKAADIGVAMGISGTDVAKGAADMVLTDDNFATIEKAIEEGRNIYNNIKKSVLFLLSSNLGEILTMFIAIVAGLFSPLKAIHILWVNLITDSLPALALGVDSGDPKIMSESPRNPKDSLFAHGGLLIVGCFGAIIGLITLLAYLYAPVSLLIQEGSPISIASIDYVLRDADLYARAQTYAFTVLAVSQLFNAIGMRNLNRSVFVINPLSNKMMVIAFFVGLGLQVAVTEVPFITEIFSTVGLSLKEWLTLGFLSTAPIWAHEVFVILKWVKGRKKA